MTVTTKEQIKALPVLLSSGQVAALLGISERNTTYQAVNGTLPAARVGRQWRFNRDKILALAGLTD